MNSVGYVVVFSNLEGKETLQALAAALGLKEQAICGTETLLYNGITSLKLSL